MVQSYRNNRKGFYTDCYQDTTPVGTIVSNLKSGANTYDHEFINKATNLHRLEDFAGNAYQNDDDPAYTHDGYLYCDGTEYNIKDYPTLYEILGVHYGGRASSGIDVTAAGSGYATTSAVTISAPPAGGVQATAVVKTVDANGGILTVDVLNPGAGYTSEPTVTVADGTSATFSVRLSSAGVIQGITTANVFDYYGEAYLGTFKVPDTVTRKIVGNGPVFGQNSPTIGNASMTVGLTGGAWYLDQNQQDDYFSLGRITTTGYDKVVETVQCSVIGSQKVTVTMEKKKLGSIFQHFHTVLHTIPGVNTAPGKAHGDRYLQGYKGRNGRISPWTPTGGVVLEHSHALLRLPYTNNTIATYDYMDYKGGTENVGAIKNVPDGSNATGSSYSPQPGFATEIPYEDQFYQASGASNSGSYEFQTQIGNPTLLKFATTSDIGGRIIETGLKPIYDYTQSWEYPNPGSYTINTSTISGVPDLLIYEIYGGGGSGAAGQTSGDDGDPSTVTVGSALVLSAGGGKKGGAAGSNEVGGQGGQGGAATETGTLTGSTVGGSGTAGTAGANTHYLEADQETDPGGGGTGGASTASSGAYGKGSDGKRVLMGGQSGTYDQTLYSDGSFTGAPTFGIDTVKFTLKGGRGGNAWNRGTANNWYQNPASLAWRLTRSNGTEVTNSLTEKGSWVATGTHSNPGNGWTSHMINYGIYPSLPANNVDDPWAGSWQTHTTVKYLTADTYNIRIESDNYGWIKVMEATSPYTVVIDRAITYGGSLPGTGNEDISLTLATGSYIIETRVKNLVLASGDGNNNMGGYGALVTLEMAEDQISTFNSIPSPGWNVIIGNGATGRSEGTNSMSANGGYGGEGATNANSNYVGRHGGGGGAVTVLRRGTQTVAGAGGGGGAGADGGEDPQGDNSISPGQSGGAYPGGAGTYTGLQSSSSGTISTGAGGVGGGYGCVGGGGGGGGAGVSSGSTLPANPPPGGGSNYGGGGAPGGPGGTPGSWGGHQGGYGGQQGISEYKSNYFSSGTLAAHEDQNGSARLEIDYNANYWTAGGGGGGSGASWNGNRDWSDLGNPSTINITVGAGGASVNPGGNNSGTTAAGNNGYVKVGVGTITGYENPQQTTTIGDVIESGSQTQTIFDISINSNGSGTGAGGNFKLPSTQLPTVLFLGGGKSNNGTPTATGYDQTGTGHAQATVTVAGGVVSGVALGTAGGTNTGYTEQPYAYLLHGAGGGSFLTSIFSNVSVNTLQLGGSAAPYTNFLKFGGAGRSTNRDRWAVIKSQDTSSVNYFGIKACRGNGVNGGDVPEEGLKVEYQLAGSMNWVYIDTIINPAASRTDPLTGMIVPECGTGVAHDGTAGDTKWYTYTVALPAAAKAPATKFRLYQERSEQGGQDHSGGGDFDHYGICEFIYFREKATTLVFVNSSGAIKRNAVDFLEYNIQGETGTGITYSSGLGCSDVTTTLKSTTKVEPQATIDPDYDVPLITPYVTCKYLIKAF